MARPVAFLCHWATSGSVGRGEAHGRDGGGNGVTGARCTEGRRPGVSSLAADLLASADGFA